MAIFPIAAEVAGLEPVKAANTEHAITELMARPPGSRPTHTCAASSRSWLALECPKIAPIRTKSGKATGIPRASVTSNTKPTMAPIVKAFTDSDLLRDPCLHPAGGRWFVRRLSVGRSRLQ